MTGEASAVTLRQAQRNQTPLAYPKCRSYISRPNGQVAQLVEQRTENPRVGGSIPSLAIVPSAKPPTLRSMPGSVTHPHPLLDCTVIALIPKGNMD